MNETTERLQKMLAHAGVASRRACEALIAAGRVAVNGQVVTELGTQVAASDRVTVDGNPIGGDAPLTYVMLNKPTGYVTTASDPEGRPTVLDLVRAPRRVVRAQVGGAPRPAASDSAKPVAPAPARGVAARLYPVGRLDVDSEGLVLLTNDGELSLHLTHPRYEQEKEYRVLVEGTPDEQILDRLRQGIDLDGRFTAPAKVRLLLSASETATPPPPVRGRRPIGATVGTLAPVSGAGPAGVRSTWLSFVIHEGRQRQVRRMCLTVGLPVKRLVRVRMGGLCLGNLPLGEWRFLNEAEIKALKQSEKGEPKPALKTLPISARKPRQRPTRNPEPKPAPKAGMRPASWPGFKTELKPGIKPEQKAGVWPVSKPEVRPERKPGLMPVRKPKPVLAPAARRFVRTTARVTPAKPTAGR